MKALYVIASATGAMLEDVERKTFPAEEYGALVE
jgi:hypothetical protein